MSGLTLISQAAGPAVAVADVRAQLAVADDSLDALITPAIAAATDQFQRDTGVQLLEAEYRLDLDGWPEDDLVRIPRPPLVTVDEVTYIDSDGVEQTLIADTDFYLDSSGLFAILEPVTSWPSVKSRRNAISVTFTCGYLSGAGTLPDSISRALIEFAAHFIINRGGYGDARLLPVPMGIERAIHSWKVDW